MQKIKKGDQVEVIAGNFKGGFQGEVQEVKTSWVVNRKKQRVMRDYNNYRVIVSGINVVKKHQRPLAANQQGGIIEFEAPIHVSNVMLVCPSCRKKTRVGFKVQDSKKLRFCKKCDATFE